MAAPESTHRVKIRFFDFILAISSGILTAFAFPKFNLSFFAWISLIPFFIVLLKKTPFQAFILGLLSGFSFYAVLIYWIPAVPAHYGNLSFGLSFTIYFLFVIFLSLFWALFAFFFAFMASRFPRSVFVAAPFFWVSFEYFLTHFLTGFPWGLLGYTQYENIYFIQMSSVTGVYGLSFVLVFFQSLFVYSMNFRKKAPFFTGLSFVLLIHLCGFVLIKDVSHSPESFKASVIQGNVSSDIYWEKMTYEEIQALFEKHLALTSQALARGSRLVVWPEFSVPMCFSCPYGIYQEFKETLFNFVQATGSTLLIGTNEKSEDQEGFRYYNTALCLNPDLSLTQYHKMHLVPFGEYTPYKKIFSFIEKLTHAIGDITPGSQHALHVYEGLKFGSPICYEIIFPNLVRKFVKKEANFLVTITNDGWYGRSSAPYQHFSIAVLRAVENRRFLLRAATTGISGIIDPYGRILSRSKLETECFLTATVMPLFSKTFYSECGDVFAFACLTLAAVFLILSLIKKRKNT